LLLVHRGQGEGESEINAGWTNVGFASGAIGLHECSASRPQSGHCCACIGVAIYGGPNLPLCAPLQPASPVLAVIYGEVGATVRADIAMAVMLGLRLTDVVLGRERERLRRCRNGRRGVGLRFRSCKWRRHGHRAGIVRKQTDSTVPL